VNRRLARSRLVQRWYPSSWRERYGEELLDFLDDTYAEARLPVRARLSVVRAGTWERCRAGGVVGDVAPDEIRIRAGSLGVLGAWALFVVAGSAFAKYSEHWDAVTPASSRALPAAAMSVMQIFAFVGVALCVAAGCLSCRSFWRLVQEKGVRTTLRLIRPALIAALVAITSTGAIVAVAHHLTSSQRNGAMTSYQVGGLVWVVTLVLCLGVGYVTVGRVVMRLDYSRRELLTLSWLSAGVTSMMVVILGSLVAWWVAIAYSARWFFGSGIVGTSSNPVPTPMVVFSLMMFAGLVVATWAAQKTVRATRNIRSHHSSIR
jgi:hypothetical protein